MTHYLQLRERLADLRILVVGDLMLDRYIHGDVSRVSPEAPVPIVRVSHETMAAGGAGNAACNARALGTQVDLVSCVGDDPSARALLEVLERLGVGTDGIVATGDRPTTTKTRLVSHQQLARFDEEETSDLPVGMEERLCGLVDQLVEAADGILVSDYAKGIVTPRIAAHAMKAAGRQGLPVVVDPKGATFEKYAGATVLTPNVAELARVATLESDAPIEDFLSAGEAIARKLASAILLTRGAEGISLIVSDGHRHYPAAARPVYDVTGAGDTVAAVTSVVLAAGEPLEVAAHLANLAGGIAVSKAGTAQVELDELLEAADAFDGRRG